VVGKTLGPYKIVEQLGKGGMGEVWLAEDARLDRQVAVKVLPAELAGDVDRRQRFEQEAKAAAALNHPNIAAIHDVGVETGEGPPTHYMVQEYLQGEVLRETISRNSLSFDKALQLAIEIGEALKTAHRAGIVHRDLKPDNVFVTQDGHAKVLDFGLAKLTEMALPSGGGPSMSPTMTMAGQMLGTAGYMSPEQVRGEEVDERADLFALGCLIYEMVTGRQAFGGNNVHESLSRILTGEPEAIAGGSGSTVRFGWILDKLLAKDREQRYQSAADVVVDLRSLENSPDSPEPPTQATPGPTRAARSPVGWIVVAAVVAAVAGALTMWMLKPATPAPATPEVVFDIVFPPGVSFSSNYNRVVAISPDGHTVAYMASTGLMLRPLDRLDAEAVPQTDSARSPAFSPDSRQVAFWANGHIKRAALGGGVPVIVGEFPERPMGIHWSEDGYIYVGRADQGIWRLPASGGEPEQVIALEAGEFAHGPELLPGGKWMLFTLGRGVRAWGDGAIVAQSLENNERRVLVQRGREARYVRSGHLAYVQDRSLFAVRFDASKVEVIGGAVATGNKVHTSAEDETGAAGYDVSDNGVLAFATPAGLSAAEMRLTWIDTDGIEEPLPMAGRRFDGLQLSPDERQIAAQISDDEGTNIWIVPVDRGTAQRLTTTGRNTSPTWSHDGRHVYFASNRDGDIDIWRRVADLSAPAEQVLDADGAQLPTSASSDGKWLLYSRMAPSNSDIGRLSLAGDSAPELLLDGPADELTGRFSADGRFFCFQSDETGGWAIHVMEIASGRRWIVSTDSGFFPVWSRDGKSIFFHSGTESIERVEVTVSPDFVSTDPVLTFKLDGARHGSSFTLNNAGDRMVVNYAADAGDRVEFRPHVTVVLNWFAELDRSTGGDPGGR
jgi:serine/threonine protein kinase